MNTASHRRHDISDSLRIQIFATQSTFNWKQYRRVLKTRFSPQDRRNIPSPVIDF